MRPIPHRPAADEEGEEDGEETSDPADRLTRDEAMAGEEKWLEVQEF